MTETDAMRTIPTDLGVLTPAELQQLGDLRQQSEQVVRQIGLNRVAEQRLLQHLQQTERHAQAVLQQTGARLGIPDGAAWQVTGDGRAVLVGESTNSPEG